jgi:hypothetical protein
MIYLISPAGGNGNYLSLTMIGVDTGNTLSYHHLGNHAHWLNDDKKILNFQQLSKKTDDTRVIIINTGAFNEAKHLITDKDTVIQNYLDMNREILLLNWFHKTTKPEDRDVSNKISGYRDTWIKWQTDLWKANSKLPVVSAVAEWMYKLFDDNFADIKRLPDIKKCFKWSAMYEGPQETVEQFKKIGFSYTIEQHDKWLHSQKIVLDHWQDIKNNLDIPLSFDDDVHKGIALALHGKQHNLDRKQVELKFNLIP